MKYFRDETLASRRSRDTNYTFRIMMAPTSDGLLIYHNARGNFGYLWSRDLGRVFVGAVALSQLRKETNTQPKLGDWFRFQRMPTHTCPSDVKYAAAGLGPMSIISNYLFSTSEMKW